MGGGGGGAATGSCFVIPRAFLLGPLGRCSTVRHAGRAATISVEVSAGGGAGSGAGGGAIAEVD